MDISIIGGDLRIAKVAEMYAKEKYKVYTYGMEKYFEKKSQFGIDNNIIICKNIEEVISASKNIISGIPLSQDDIFREAKKNIEQAPKELVKIANENGGYDNITVIIIKNI